MITRNTFYTTLGALGILALLGASLFLAERPAKADIYTGTVLSQASTTAAIAVTSNTQLLATTTSNPINGGRYTRVYATICNPNANPVFIAMNQGNAASASDAVTVIAAASGYQSCYEITSRNMYQGAVEASSTNQTSTTVSVTDYVQ